MISGEHSSLNKLKSIMEKSIKSVDAYRKKVFKKGFDFTKKESVQLDPEKRKWSKSNKEKLAIWRKLFKQATLNRYIDLWNEQLDLKKEKKEKKIQKKKKGKRQKG